MANGDRRNTRYLYAWHNYNWAKSAATEQTPPVNLPTVGSITNRTAVVTLGYTATPVQAGRHRVTFGTRSNKYDRSSGVVANAEGSTITVRLTELLPATTYYLCDVVEPLPPTADPTRGGAYRAVSSAEVSFITLA